MSRGRTGGGRWGPKGRGDGAAPNLSFDPREGPRRLSLNPPPPCAGSEGELRRRSDRGPFKKFQGSSQTGPAEAPRSSAAVRAVGAAAETAVVSRDPPSERPSPGLRAARPSGRRAPLSASTASAKPSAFDGARLASQSRRRGCGPRGCAPVSACRAPRAPPPGATPGGPQGLVAREGSWRGVRGKGGPGFEGSRPQPHPGTKKMRRDS